MGSEIVEDKAKIEFHLLKSELIANGDLPPSCREEKFSLNLLDRSTLTEEGNNTFASCSLLLWPRSDSRSSRVISFLQAHEHRGVIPTEINSSTTISSFHHCCGISKLLIQKKVPNAGVLPSKCVLYLMSKCEDPKIKSIVVNFQNRVSKDIFSFDEFKKRLVESSARTEEEIDKKSIESKKRKISRVISLLDPLLKEKLLEKPEDGHMFSQNFFMRLTQYRECLEEALTYLNQEHPIDISGKIMEYIALVFVNESEESNDYNGAQHFLHLKMEAFQQIVNGS